MTVHKMEDYRIKLRWGREVETGVYEITKKGTTRRTTRFAESYETLAGIYDPQLWYQMMKDCVVASESQELFNRILEHCRTNCVWLKNDKELNEYALEIISGRIYRHWEDFPLDGVTENTAFVFEMGG